MSVRPSVRLSVRHQLFLNFQKLFEKFKNFEKFKIFETFNFEKFKKGIPQAKIIIAALGFYVRGHFGYVAAIFNLVYRFTMKPNQMCFVEFDSLSNLS